MSAHPLFPAIVALWFAALLGIGCLVLPQALYDKLGVTLGLGALGMGARVVVALVAGALGGALGMFLARKAAAGTDRAPVRKAKVQSDTAPAKRPISALEELGSDGLDEPVANREAEPFTGRRRALAVTDESGPSEYLAQVPLPSGGDALDLIGADLADEDDALDLHSFAEDLEPETAQHAPAAPARFAAAPAAGAMAERQIFRPVEAAQGPLFGRSDADWTPEPVAEHGADVAVAATTESPDFSPRPFASPNAAAPTSPAAPFSMPFAAPAPAVEPAPVAEPEAVGSPELPSAELAAAARPVFAPFAAPQGVPVEQTQPRPSVATAAISDQTLVALIDRFAQALRQADPASAGPQVASGLRRFGPEMVAAASLMPAMSQPESALPEPPQAEAPVAPSFPMPDALQPVRFDDYADSEDDEIEDDFAHPFALPLGTASKPFAAPAPFSAPTFGGAAPAFGMPQAVEAASEEQEPATPSPDESFGSLLAMKSGLGSGREFVRVDDEDDIAAEHGAEPVVVFPGAASHVQAVSASNGASSEPAPNTPFAPPAPFAAPPFAQAPFAQAGFARAPFGQAQPAAAAPDRQATEQALREALAKLQQMSGAA